MDKKTRGEKKVSYIFVLIPSTTACYLTIAGYGFFFGRLGCDFFEHVGEKLMDIRRFLGYVCQIAKVSVHMSFGWVSLFAQKYVFFDFFVRMRI